MDSKMEKELKNGLMGKYLKEKLPDVKIVAVEPKDSPVLSEGRAGGHKIQGIGGNFIPDTYDASVVDEVLGVSDDEAYEMARALAREEGLLVGISSGAAVAAALKVAKEYTGEGRIVVVLPDTGERYLSTDLF